MQQAENKMPPPDPMMDDLIARYGKPQINDNSDIEEPARLENPEDSLLEKISEPIEPSLEELINFYPRTNYIPKTEMIIDNEEEVSTKNKCRPKTLKYKTNEEYLAEEFNNILTEKPIINYKAKYKNINLRISENAFLWLAKKEGCSPIYIFNSMHLLTGIDANDVFGEAFNTIIDKVDTVFTEVESNVPLEDTTVKLSNGLIGYRLDCIIARKSEDMGKTLKCLESTEIRKNLNADQTKANALYKAKIQQYGSEAEYLLQESQNYLTHVNPSSESAVYQEIKEFVAPGNRNAFWMGSILSESSENKSSLVVCGSGHSSGKYGLPNLLAAEGYNLEPLMKTPPLSKKNMLKTLVYGTNTLGYFKPPRAELHSHAKSEETQCKALSVVRKFD